MLQIQGVKGEAVVKLRRTLDNAGDAVLSTFPKGKQHGEYTIILSLTICGILKQGIVQLQPAVFIDSYLCSSRVVYATLGVKLIVITLPRMMSKEYIFNSINVA
jgi:hypothetical protein